jgi:predicted dehydrogenase
VFGGHHAAKYAAIEGVRLAAVYDHHHDHAQALAARHGAEAFDTLEPFLEAVDAVTVATPADTHGHIAAQALAAGRHAYVEKPLAVFGGDAALLVATAADKRLVLACGHQERVVFEAMGLLGAPERPVRIEAVRRGTPSLRNRDASAVLDLMVHDLDLALALTGAGPAEVTARGGYDDLWAEVDFEGGSSARFAVSRLADGRERTMRLVYPSGEVRIDFLAPSFDNGAGFPLDADFAETAAGRDPLGTSVARFVAAIVGQAERPAVTGAEGARALELALRIEAAAGL